MHSIPLDPQRGHLSDKDLRAITGPTERPTGDKRLDNRDNSCHRSKRDQDPQRDQLEELSDYQRRITTELAACQIP